MSNTNYDYVYNVGLLDDLHNYFPAFLYDSGRFQTPLQVFSYLRTQLQRFNLPAFGARLAGFGSAPAPTPAPAAQAAQARTTAALTTLLAGLLDIPASPIYTDYTYYTIPRNFMDAVPLTPSPQVISSNTRIVTGENGLCTICQDSILPTESCRRLTNCRHVYHTVCIDQWFQTNVQCPVCRMDIRGSVDVFPPASNDTTRHLSTMAYLSNWNTTHLSTMSNVSTMAHLSTMSNVSTMAHRSRMAHLSTMSNVSTMAHRSRMSNVSTMAHLSTMANWGMSNA